MASLIDSLKKPVNWCVNSFGYKIVKREDPPPIDISAVHLDVAQRVATYSMTGIEALSAAQSSIEYIVSNKIPGAIVECGVWRGGTVMAMLMTLLRLGDTSRSIYLFDTFAGMTPPTDFDRDLFGRSAEELLRESKQEPGSNVWAIATLDDVRNSVIGTGYPVERIHFIQGDVMTTLPQHVPEEEIALLRLDTDWYESTKHELNTLYPSLNDGGVLIVDDYGHYAGARRAVDEYFSDKSFRPMFVRIDYTVRLLLKNKKLEAR